MKLAWPRSLAGQMITALLVALAVTQAVSFAIFASERRQAVMSARREQVVQRTASLIRMIEHGPDHLGPDMQTALLRAATSARLRFSIDDDSAVPIEIAENRDNRIVQALADLLDESAARPIYVEIKETEGLLPARAERFWRRMHRRWDGDDDDRHDHHERWRHDREAGVSDFGSEGRARRYASNLTIAVSLHSGQWLNAEMAVPPPRGWAFPSLVAMFLMAAAICGITVFVVRRLTRPLAKLAVAADALGRGETVPPLAPAGPNEVRRTTQAFNQMQDRLHRFARDRTAMLAAVSHDLRTPLTSLRLRAEFITDDLDNKRRILETLEEMERIIETTLNFAREDANKEPTIKTEIVALIASMTKDFEDLKMDVRFEPRKPVYLTCRPTTLKRALRNLVENAVAYGTRAVLRVETDASEVRIVIEDEGPGIPNTDMETVFEPFTRLETSRSKETGGVGLGLAIARGIVRAHGGDIVLANLPGAGLQATVVLPLPQAAG